MRKLTTVTTSIITAESGSTSAETSTLKSPTAIHW